MNTSMLLWAPIALGLMAPAVPPLHADRVAMRATLQRAQRVEIRWSWGGLGQPLAKQYQLAVQGGRIVGGNVPMPLYKRFLEILRQAPLVPGPYLPWFTHTDDYPSISILVTAGGRSVRFFTESQGFGHDPWGVEVAGHTHVVPSDAPQRALDVLIPALEPPEEAARMVTPPSRRRLEAREILQKAIVGNDVERVRRLLAAGQVRFGGPEWPLHYAAIHGRADIIELLVRAGAPVDLASPGGFTALRFAAGDGYLAAVRKLLALGARDRRGLATAVHDAARRGHSDTVRELIKAGAEVDFSDEHGWRPIMCVLVPDTLRLLLSAGARVEARTSDGRTPLMMAVSPGPTGCGSRPQQVAAVRTLIEAGASVNVADSEQRTPLMWASTLYGDPGILRELLAAGAKVDARDGKGRTALFYAAAPPAIPERQRLFPHAPSVAVLLEAGADVRARDSQGKTVLDYLGAASDLSSQGVREMLEQAR